MNMIHNSTYLVRLMKRHRNLTVLCFYMVVLSYLSFFVLISVLMLTDYKKPVPFVALSIFTFFLFVYLCYKELNKWRAAANGVTGEDTFRDTLSGIVDNDSVVFHSVPTYWGDIDYLLVSPGGVYAFEIKHHSGHICYDRAGWTRTKISGGGVAYTGGIGNPSGQLTRNILWLKDYLNSEGIDSVWINGI